MNDEKQTRIALWRLGVLGPLVSARLERGDRSQLFKEAAARTYQDYAGRRIRLSTRTVEAWYYRWVKGGFEALMPRSRSDSGHSRAITPDIAELICALKREKPRRSIRRIIRMLEREGKVPVGSLSRSSVHRLLKAQGISRQALSYEKTERRRFRHPYANDVWMGDVMHGPRVMAPDSRERKSYLHLFLDSATRFVPGAGFRLSETAADHEAILKQGILKHGLPRVLYLDRGPAQVSDSLKLICADLGIRLLHARPYDPMAKGAVERIFLTLRQEMLSELPPQPCAIEELNSILWSWLSAEYHRRVHGGTRKVPLEHWLEHMDRIRPAPHPDKLDTIFLHRAKRKVRMDSTVRFDGKLLEVRSELSGMEVELRFDPHTPGTLPQVFNDGTFYCDTILVDPVRNSFRKRRRIKKIQAQPNPTGIDPLKQIQDEHARRVRPPRYSKEE
jgi:putative transposase